MPGYGVTARLKSSTEIMFKMKTLLVSLIASLAVGSASASWMTKASQSQSARLANINAQYNKLSNTLTAKYGLNTSNYKKLAAKSTSALNFNRLANSIKYDHGYAVNAIYRGYHPYTTRAVKGKDYRSISAMARAALQRIKRR